MTKVGILVALLMSVGYKLDKHNKWKDTLENIRNTFPVLKSHDGVDDDVLIENLRQDKLLKSDEMSNVMFECEDVRHHVMSIFVTKCLKTNEDYENYVNLSSVDSLLEYVRTWRYIPDDEERCMFLPYTMTDFFISNLGIDAIRHVIVEKNMNYDGDIRTKVSSLCKCVIIQKYKIAKL
jgi:hypothetical protein